MVVMGCCDDCRLNCLWLQVSLSVFSFSDSVATLCFAAMDELPELHTAAEQRSYMFILRRALRDDGKEFDKGKGKGKGKGEDETKPTKGSASSDLCQDQDKNQQKKLK